MAEYNTSSIASGAVLLFLIALLSLPSISGLVSHFYEPMTKPTLYEDADGVASEKSVAEYSAAYPKVILSIFTVVGCATAVCLALFSTTKRYLDSMVLENWLIACQWLLVLIQSLGVLRIRKPSECYGLGIGVTASCILLSLNLLYCDWLFVHNFSAGSLGSPLVAVLRFLRLAFAALAAGAGVSIPRRPNVFKDGAPVDAMYTVSAVDRYSFSWAANLLYAARERNRLDLEDLPRMDHLTRSRDLDQSWRKIEHRRKLWIEIFIAHKKSFIIQWCLALAQALGNFAPQFFLFHILKILEARVSDQAVSSQVWLWVLYLTLSTSGFTWIESWLFWISWSEIAIPIRAQISCLIFQKAMRRKDVKGASKTKGKGSGGPDISEGPLVNSTAANKLNIDDEKESDPKSQQSTVNLIGVDTKRLSDFCSFNYCFPGSIFKLSVSITFLLNVIGWKPLVIGFAAFSIIVPLNIFVSKRYAAAQGRLMKVRDSTVGILTEAMRGKQTYLERGKETWLINNPGIRQIKFFALESSWHKKISKVREKELCEQWNVYASETMLLFCWITSPILLSATALTVYTYENGGLLPSVAFTSIGVFNSLEATLARIPELTTQLIDAKISIDRIEKYLAGPEVVPHMANAQNISFVKASVAWPSDEEKGSVGDRYVLRDINASFPENELSVISGKTGTGKSLLLAAILGEVDILSGTIYVPQRLDCYDNLVANDDWIIPSSIAFVAQIPWLENTSIKDNIIFGLPFDEERYSKVIDACALRRDLDMLTDGEGTEIGANGVNLSSGQRWRVTFARALYSRAGILILDDIFSAVDTHVARHIFENGLTGELCSGRTRILVTHHVELCRPKTRYVVELGYGTVENAGFVDDLRHTGEMQNLKIQNYSSLQTREDIKLTAVNSEELSQVKVGEVLKEVDLKRATKKFVPVEDREHGRVQNHIYLDYIKASGGWPFWLVGWAVFAALQILITGRSWFLKLWTSNNIAFLGDSSFPPHDLSYYLGIYVTFSASCALLGTFRYYYIFTGSIRASRKLFDKLCFVVLRTPLRWVDTVPLGRILNRFMADFDIVDAKLSKDVSYAMINVFRLLGVVITAIFVSPYIILPSLVLLFLCVNIATLYLYGAREVKRLGSNTKSPVFEQFGSALTGVATIRAFSKTDTYISRMFTKIDDYSTTIWHTWIFNRWMGLRMSIFGGFFTAIVVVMVVLLPDIDAALAGFALCFALEYSQALIWTIRHIANLELDMNSAERIIEFSNLSTESIDGADPPAHWPNHGCLEFNDLVVSYAVDQPPVLKGVSFRVERNERIGVVGRTGAGKSSITLALFRLLDAQEGSIYIDGLDISTIKLQALRSRIAIIPQDPVLFSGTVRSNLDPFDKYNDSELHDALERAHLVRPGTVAINSEQAGAVSTLTSGSFKTEPKHLISLTSPISEGGLNLSQGQRQLLCLARAIVSRSKIMVLDEATSAVDITTDTLIRRTIREEFRDSTLIVIAHRLSTIADFDKILVFEDGEVAEFGTPRSLMESKKGSFRAMVMESGDKEQLVALILGT